MGRTVGVVGRCGRAVRTVAVLGAWAWAGAGWPPRAQEPPVLTFEQLFEKAKRSVLRLEVLPEPVPGDPAAGVTVTNGSAVVLSLEPQGFLTVATAYHVLVRARSLRVYAPGKAEAVADSAGSGAECFVDRSRELAFVRIAVDPARVDGLAVVDAGAGEIARVPANTGQPAPSPTGLALGFSREGSVPLDEKRIDLRGLVSADRLGLVRPISFKQATGELVPGQMEFQLLGDQATLEGMSGGLVVDQRGRFAGLVYGRRTDEFNLVIAAVHLLSPWGRAREQLRQTGHWPSLSERTWSGPTCSGRGPTRRSSTAASGGRSTG